MPVKIPKKFIENEITKYRTDVKKLLKHKKEAPKKIITISRDRGTGGRKIAEEIGKKLDCTVWGREILDVLSDRSGVGYQNSMLEALDEKKQGFINTLIADFFGHVDKHTYFYLLPKAVYLIAENNAVIIGRGAHLLLPDAFRVVIRASNETRTKNIMHYDGLDEKAARAYIKQTDKERDAFLKELEKKIGVKHQELDFDLEINADRLDIKDATSIIMHGFAQYYYHLRERQEK
ncbi:AAA family ATPase [Thermodesulfobacteriota bacterium]